MISPERLKLAVETMCQSLRHDPNFNIRIKAAETLGKLGSEEAIPCLCDAWQHDDSIHVRLAAADAIVQIATLKQIPIMTESSKNQPTFNINQVGNINTGDVNIQRDQVGIQYNYGSDQDFEVLLADYKQFISELEQKYPQPTDDTNALQIIDVEFKELEQKQPLRLQNFLNLKRLWNGGKKAAIKVGEHFTENNPWGKGAIAFLEGISEDIK